MRVRWPTHTLAGMVCPAAFWLRGLCLPVRSASSLPARLPPRAPPTGPHARRQLGPPAGRLHDCPTGRARAVAAKRGTICCQPRPACESLARACFQGGEVRGRSAERAVRSNRYDDDDDDDDDYDDDQRKYYSCQKLPDPPIVEECFAADVGKTEELADESARNYLNVQMSASCLSDPLTAVGCFVADLTVGRGGDSGEAAAWSSQFEIKYGQYQ